MDSSYSNRRQAPDAGVRPLSTVLKTLEIIDHFATCTRPQRLSDVTQVTGLSRATAYQRLLTLVSAGWLEQDDVGRYRLSMLSTRLAAAALDQADIGVRSEPALTRLMTAAGETASLSILDRGQPCIVARVESDTLLRAEQKIGTYMSLEGSASGRVLVAFADDVTLERLRAGPHELPTDEVLGEVHADGYALSSGYTHSGVRGFAAPVFDLHGRCRATVSLVAPVTRFDLEAFRAPVLEAAKELTNILHGGGQ
ncbi:IclR family transcriptional regulator [Pseudoruegeria sp. HB172150]|uniref:IclR family transcriptional regulator n=1 Tax=Pseudoruegeria sp. HB172150 TaxID=2721164 RepID=UPI0015538FB4|nr:IclR family transcriptional regulator [Pseudoruegeria sp. HB172150]